jgi:predicted P-loop ATPase
MDEKIDFKYLARAVLSRANEFLPAWLPGGVIEGREYVCANIRGGEGKSFKVNTTSGKWADFAAGQKGGDLISLYAEINNLSQLEAAKILSKEVGHRLPDPRSTIQPAPNATVFIKPPKGTKRPSFIHSQFGTPTVTYTYRDESGDVLFFVSRFDPQGEKKQFIPASYSADGKWHNRMWPAPRPMFGLEFLTPDNFKKPIMLVEGEKAAIAARQIVKDNYIVMSWPGGAQAWNKVDWSPIHGRNLLIWPDADEPGRNCAAAIAGHLYPVVKEIKIINVPTDMFDGWDAADALAENYDWDSFKTWAKPLAEKIEIKPSMESLPMVPDTAPINPAPWPDEPATPANVNIAIVTEGELTDKQPPKSLAAVYLKCGIECNRQGIPHCNADSILKLLHGIPEFKDVAWYDDFHKKIFTNREGKIREWADVDTTNLMILCQGNYGFHRLTSKTAHEAITSYAYQNVHNEALEWFRTLKWDGTPRVDRLFSDHFGAEDNEYTHAACRNMWLSIAARVLYPGCKADAMVILEGPQGAYKSTAVAAIGGKFYGKAFGQAGSKDFYMSLQSKMLVEIAELDSFTKADVTKIKDVLSSPIDEFRPPYGRAQELYPRQCIFVGTTNDAEYLSDSTGARRFWPIKIGKCDIKYIKENRDQLFAEAVERVTKGETWWVMPESTEQHQEVRRLADPWESLVSNWLHGRDGLFFTHEIAVGALNMDASKLDHRAARRIGKIMRMCGWEYKAVRERDMITKKWTKSFLVETTMKPPTKPIFNHADNIRADFR